MSLGMLAAVLLQTTCIIAFILVLTPFRLPTKKTLLILGCILAAFTIITSCLAIVYGTVFLMRYGFAIIGTPLFVAVYFLSRARGIRFVFVALTAVIFQQMLLTLLMAYRILHGGFTPLYFLLNVLAFGALLGGGVLLRKDYHKIVLSYRYEFICLSAILLLLFLFAVAFSPITATNTVDPDFLFVIPFLDLLIVLIYIYIGVSFHSLGKRIDIEKDELSLRFQTEEAENNLSRLRASQVQFFTWHQDRQQHISTIKGLLERGELDSLRDYLDKIGMDLDDNLPETYCKNEAVNLLLASYSARAAECGVAFLIDTQLPGNLSIGSTELCALLGNALDNAFHAAQRVDWAGDKAVRLMARLSGGKLLIQVQNPYSGEIPMENGLPHGAKQSRGFGVRSMEVLVAKHGGLSAYEARDGIFTVRFAI